MEHTNVICRACPTALTREQVRRGCRACSRVCGGKRFRPFTPRRCKVCPHQLTKDQIRRDGVVCSSACAGILSRSLPLAQRRAKAMNGNAARAAKRLRLLITEIVTDCQPFLGDASLELKKAVAKVVLKHRGIGYHRGWGARDARERRRRTAA